MEKKCKECGIIKNVKEFSKRRSTKDGYQYKCKGCANIYNKKWREENRDYFEVYYEENRDRLSEYREENRDRISEYSKVYYEENKDRISEYYQENKGKRKQYYREWREENKDYFNEYNRKKILTDPLYKLKKNMRNLISNSLRNNGYKKNSRSVDILGCSFEKLLKHLNNNIYGFIYGAADLDIDHITPLSRATTKDEIIKLNHYTNLQLLPADYNRYIKRDNDFDKEDFERWLEKNNLKK